MPKTILRDFMKRTSWTGSRATDLEDTDQTKGVPPPPLELGYDKTKRVIELPSPRDIKVDAFDLRDAIEKRVSVRSYAEEPISLEELSWLLWCTQGVKQVTGMPSTLRTVPSGGARHPFETYMLVNRVEGLSPGLYRFLAVEHKLVELGMDEGLADEIAEACWGQPFIKKNAATFIWAFVPYRSIWRFGKRGGRAMMEAGHICQNLYLSAEAIRCGVCAIGAFSDERMNDILGIDTEEQFVVYMATVGKKK